MMKKSKSKFIAVFLFLFVAGIFTVVVPSVLVAEESNWNQFGGPNHDNHSLSTVPTSNWEQSLPKLVWEINTLGKGYSNLAFWGNTIYTMGDIDNDCCVMAIDEATGKTLWTTPIDIAASPGRYDGPKATPAVDEQFVFAFSQLGFFACLDRKTGKKLWTVNTPEELGGRYANNWGYSSSPIFDGDNVIVQVGGQNGMLASYSKKGKLQWQSKDLKDPAAYATPVIAEIEGVRQFIIFANTGVYGLAAKDGALLWGVERPSSRPVCSNPVVKDNIVFVASAYGIGAHAYKITKKGKTFDATLHYADPSLLNHHGGIVRIDDYLYLTSDRSLVCLEIKTGNIAWQDRSVGKGSLIKADQYLVVRSETGEGTVALVEASPSGYKEFGRFDQPNRSNKNSWTYPVVVHQKLFIRDQQVLQCYGL